MNAEIGHFALILALAVVAIFQMIAPMIGAQKGWSGWTIPPAGGAGAIRP